jgi:hypothetical protein
MLGVQWLLYTQTVHDRFCHFIVYIDIYFYIVLRLWQIGFIGNQHLKLDTILR